MRYWKSKIQFHVNVVALVILVTSFYVLNNEKPIQIVTSLNPSITESITAKDLQEDLQKVMGQTVQIVDESTANSKAIRYVIGTATSNMLMHKMLKDSNIKLSSQVPGARGGIWQRIDANTIILGGSDVQGMQYAVYDYSEEILGLDPLQYWTGHHTTLIATEDLFAFNNKVIEPPKVPLLVYFENDVDELINLKEPLLEYDWESYTEMIDALVRMRYNGIQMFDLLGRAEFYLREEYQKLVPEYAVDLDKIEKMINYAQDKGMAVQIDLSLGYQFKSLESQYADCWKDHKEKWIAIWKYYLEETPIGKADIYALRPRNQVWDWEYASTCGEAKIEVFNEVYHVLDSVVEAHNDKATKVVICYADGMDMYNDGFAPPSDWIIAWSDDGYSDFKAYPSSTQNYLFGTYMHAGFWKNHTINHPYPDQIDTIMHLMFDKYDASSYCMVNGQQFRPFILNIEAFSEACKDPEDYSGQKFLESWASRYFHEDLHDEVIELMKDWDKASFGKAGYVQNLWEIKEVIAYLAELPIQNPGKNAQAFSAERVTDDRSDAAKRYDLFQSLIQKSRKILPKTNEESAYYYDQIHYPLESYTDLLALEVVLHKVFEVKRQFEESPGEDLKLEAKSLLRQAQDQLAVIHRRTAIPAKDPKWNGWYDLKKRRPNNGFPIQEMLKEVELAIDNKWQLGKS